MRTACGYVESLTGSTGCRRFCVRTTDLFVRTRCGRLGLGVRTVGRWRGLCVGTVGAGVRTESFGVAQDPADRRAAPPEVTRDTTGAPPIDVAAGENRGDSGGIASPAGILSADQGGQRLEIWALARRIPEGMVDDPGCLCLYGERWDLGAGDGR